jgi:hemerythrin superfamily protein
MNGASDLPRPADGDVVELILDDHRLFESLLRQLRDTTADRDVVRRALAALHVAHAEAEEQHVYPALRDEHAIGEHEAEHGEEEHEEGHRAVLAVLTAEELDGEGFEDLVEELSGALSHHIAEEELTILSPARERVAEDVRRELGRAFADERNKQLDSDCGRVENVRAIVEGSGHATASQRD